MTRIYHLDGSDRHDAEENPCSANSSPRGVPSFELGLEIALVLLEQIEKWVGTGQASDVFFHSVRHFTRAKSALLLASTANGAQIQFSHFDLPRDTVDEVCSPAGFYTKLARIRFAHFYPVGALELENQLPRTHPPIDTLFAVPTLREGKPAGCLAVFNRTVSDAFSKTDALVLSVAAALLSFGNTYLSLRDKHIPDSDAAE
ncbi:MAG: hypothetical protein QNJ97_11835 [Myxococcota bacterium]|nr:hypothetical protein [Myxococcota bacterium]